jgi:hypothetical protein
MSGVVSAAVPVCYVQEMGRSQAFYALLGFAEQRTGGDGNARWSYLESADQTLLLVHVQPPLIPVELPLLIYFYVDDLAVVRRRFTEASYPLEHVGYPDHAPGGEARATDPDGNIVLIGQRVAVGTDAQPEATGEPARFSLIKQAADAVSRRGGAPATCQIGGAGGAPCTRAAEVKLADPWGDTVWGCLEHAEEALIAARSAFIATEDGEGLGPFLRNRHPGRTSSAA